MDDTFLHGRLESRLVHCAQTRSSCFQLGQEKLQAGLLESLAGELRQDILPTHPTREQQGLPSHWVLPHFDELKHWKVPVYTVSNVSLYSVTKR